MKNPIVLILVSLIISSCAELSRKETFTIYGCTDVDGENYAKEATKSDGSCTYLSGCTDSEASNYNYLAKVEDGTCTYAKRIVFYSTGAWASSNETPTNVMVYDANNRNRIGIINNFSTTTPVNCMNLVSNGRVVISDLSSFGSISSKGYYAILNYSYYDVNLKSYRNDSRQVDFTINTPSGKGYCVFHTID